MGYMLPINLFASVIILDWKYYWLIWNQTDVRLVPNQSENGKYNLISVWFNKISLCVRTKLFNSVVNIKLHNWCLERGIIYERFCASFDRFRFSILQNKYNCVGPACIKHLKVLSSNSKYITIKVLSSNSKYITIKYITIKYITIKYITIK